MAYLLGVYGKMYNGKSTLAKTLVATGAWDVVSFASPLKIITKKILILTGHTDDMAQSMVYGNMKGVWSPALGMATRQLMQLIGTEFRMIMEVPDLWMDIGLNEADKLRRKGRNVVIDDVRFEREIKGIRRVGGQVCGLRRPGAHTPVFSEEDAYMVARIRQTRMLDGYRQRLDGIFSEAFVVMENVWPTDSAAYDMGFRRAWEKHGHAFVASDVLPKVTTSPSSMNDGSAPHISEADFPPSMFDDYIVNDGTLGEFKARVNDMIAKLDLKSVSETRKSS